MLQNVTPDCGDSIGLPNTFMGVRLIDVTSEAPVINKPYIVKNLLLQRQVSMLVGPPNVGKSSVVAALAAHVAMGRQMQNLKVTEAAVLYVAAEDPHGIQARAYGYFHGMSDSRASFGIMSGGFDLGDKELVQRFIHEANLYRAAGKAGAFVIIFDTLNLCLGARDENNAGEMSQVITNARRIADETGAHVLIVHHPTASDPRKPRGSTAFVGNVDTVLVLEKAAAERSVRLVTVKQRSCEVREPLIFQLEGFALGYDADGEAVSVPMAQLVEVQDMALLARQETDGLKAPSVMGRRKAELLKIFQGAGDARLEISGLAARVGGCFEELQGNASSLRKAIKRALDELVKDKAIQYDEAKKCYWVVCKDTQALKPVH